MKNVLILTKFITIYLFLSSLALSSTNDFFKEGKILFDEKKFDKSKILFERDIVFNPKSEKSYLYLAKIFKGKENDTEEERNLNNVLLLNPNNDEAIYMLTILKIKQSDYVKAKELIEQFNLVCKTFCQKKSEMENKLDKIIPEDEKNNN
tara:strand:+ start:322 stop:771 length:450 start_codon:yes stop_codon:yes gene_type:complete